MIKHLFTLLLLMSVASKSYASEVEKSTSENNVVRVYVKLPNPLLLPIQVLMDSEGFSTSTVGYLQNLINAGQIKKSFGEEKSEWALWTDAEKPQQLASTTKLSSLVRKKNGLSIVSLQVKMVQSLSSSLSALSLSRKSESKVEKKS